MTSATIDAKPRIGSRQAYMMIRSPSYYPLGLEDIFVQKLHGWHHGEESERIILLRSQSLA